ncbi:MAG: phosphatidylglycerophosphatase A [Planctomycetes bacterium]|nr:phosphatidylglycerophosphatase A [Planctomycetota bacterium]
MAFLRDTDPSPRELFLPAILVGSLGLSGFVPRARGTAGTAVCLLVGLGLFVVDLHAGLWLPLAAATAAFSWIAGSQVLRRLPDLKDPSWFVMDEAAGYFLTLGLLRADSLLAILAGFLTFRFYDIAKPWPVRSFERIPGSLGILADDLAAGVLAAWTCFAVTAISSALV